MRILITGGAGFIGSHLAEAHLEQGDEVYIIDDLSTGSMENIAHIEKNEAFQNRIFVRINTILNHETMLELVGICDRIYHMAVTGVVHPIRDR